jgi:hypothetical protein
VRIGFTGRFIRTLLAQVPGVNPQQIGVQQSTAGTPLAPPTQTAASTATTGGTIAANTYYLVVTAENALGETVASNEESITTTGTTSTITANFALPSGATGGKLYVGTATGLENVVTNFGAVSTLTITAIPTLSGTPPTSNTTANTAGFRVIVGGTGDPYEVANAILQSVADPTDLTGSAVSSTRNVRVSVSDYPDTYSIVYVVPPSQTVTMVVTWNTSLSNFAGGGTFQALVAPIIAQYVSNLAVGAPINELEMTYLFQQAVAAQIDQNLITRLVFSGLHQRLSGLASVGLCRCHRRSRGVLRLRLHGRHGHSGVARAESDPSGVSLRGIRRRSRFAGDHRRAE